MALPLPKVVADVGPGGPFVTSARGLNALRKDQAEAQYAPYTNYANALSKVAYAKTAPANAIAQLMSGPAAANLSREQQVALATQLQNMVKNSGDYSNTLPPPNTGGMFGNSLVGKALGAAINKIMPQAQSSSNALNMPQTRNDFTPMDQLPAGTNGINAQPSPGGGRYQQSADSLKIPGSQGGFNPATGSEATAAAIKAGATGEASAQVEQQKNMENQDTAQANNAVEMINQINKLKDARSRLGWYEKGFPLGKGMAMTSPSQEFDQTKENIANMIASASQSGHINVADRETSNLMKPGRDINEEGFNHLINYAEGASHRISEKPAFDLAMSKMGYTPSQIQVLWTNYGLKKPFFNTKTHTIDEGNIGSWERFYNSSKNRNSAFSPSSQKKVAAANPTTSAPPATATSNAKGTVEKQFDLTGFKNEDEFQKWFKSQNKDTQNYVKRQIEAGVY